MGIDVVAIPALMGEVILNPMVKQHWLPTMPNTAARHNKAMCRGAMCSRRVKSEAIQKSKAPPATRNDTMSMPSNPWVMASLPNGAIKPQKEAAPSRQRCAVRGTDRSRFSERGAELDTEGSIA